MTLRITFSCVIALLIDDSIVAKQCYPRYVEVFFSFVENPFQPIRAGFLWFIYSFSDLLHSSKPKKLAWEHHKPKCCRIWILNISTISMIGFGTKSIGHVVSGGAFPRPTCPSECSDSKTTWFWLETEEACLCKSESGLVQSRRNMWSYLGLSPILLLPFDGLINLPT